MSAPPFLLPLSRRQSYPAPRFSSSLVVRATLLLKSAPSSLSSPQTATTARSPCAQSTACRALRRCGARTCSAGCATASSRGRARVAPLRLRLSAPSSGASFTPSTTRATSPAPFASSPTWPIRTALCGSPRPPSRPTHGGCENARVRALHFSNMWVQRFLRRAGLRRRRVTSSEQERPPAVAVVSRMTAIQAVIASGPVGGQPVGQPPGYLLASTPTRRLRAPSSHPSISTFPRAPRGRQRPTLLTVHASRPCLRALRRATCCPHFAL
jgi:hypothetical protein